MRILGGIALAALVTMSSVAACGDTDDNVTTGPGGPSVIPNGDSGAALPALSDSASPDSASSDSASAAISAAIGPTGGLVTLGPITLDVPAGAVAAQVTISMSTGATAVAGYTVDGAWYHFEPSGLHFDKPVTIRMPAKSNSALNSIYWSISGKEDLFERLPTTFEDGNATAVVTHFSSGFAGSQPLVCTSQWLVKDGAGNCTRDTRVESDLHLWFGANAATITTDSIAIRGLNPSGDVFVASDQTHVLYGSMVGAGSVQIDGQVAVLTLSATNTQVYVGCNPPNDTLPYLAVQCAGVTLLGPPPVTDAGVDSGPDSSVANDASAGDASTGVTCIRKQRVLANSHCTQSETVENVKLYLVRQDADLEGAISTDSVGMSYLFASGPGHTFPFFTTVDGTHTTYQSSNNWGTVQRDGNSGTISFHGARAGTNPNPDDPACATIPLYDVTCTGTGQLNR